MQHYTVNFTELIVVRYIRTAAITAQCAQHIGCGKTCTFALGGIHLNGYLREIHRIRSIRHSHFRPLVQRTDELHHVVVEHIHITTCLVLHIQLDGVTHTVARNHCGLEAEDAGFLDLSELGVEPCHYRIGGMFRTFALVPMF